MARGKGHCDRAAALHHNGVAKRDRLAVEVRTRAPVRPAKRRLPRVRLTLTAGARTIDSSRGSGGAQRGTDMPTSGILDLAIGLAFVFGAAAALSSVVTELIARCLGLRGAYLLRGLRELLDSEDASMNLATARVQYDAMKDLITGDDAPAVSVRRTRGSRRLAGLTGARVRTSMASRSRLATPLWCRAAARSQWPLPRAVARAVASARRRR